MPSRSSPPGDAPTLATADALREGPVADRLRAVEVYRLLSDTLDPADPIDTTRLRWAMQHAPRKAAFATLGERAVSAEDPGTRDAGALFVAQCLSGEMRYREAEQAMRAVYERHRGTGSSIEQTVLTSLAMTYAASHRELEAWIAASLALQHPLTDTGTWPQLLCRLQIALSLRALLDFDDLETELHAIEPLLAFAPDEQAASVAALYFGMRAECRLHASDAKGARAALAQGIAQREALATKRRDSAYFVCVRARVLLAEGELDLAMETIRPALEAPAPAPAEVAVQIALARGSVDEARGIAQGLRRRVAGRPPWLTAGFLYRATADIGVMLYNAVGAAEEASWALSTAAHMAIRRTSEVQQTIAWLPELETLDRPTRSRLERFREVFAERHEALMPHLARTLLAEAASGEQPFATALDSNRMLVVCAWCQRMESQLGTWVPLVHTLPLEDSAFCTHTICPSCEAEVHTEPDGSVP